MPYVLLNSFSLAGVNLSIRVWYYVPVFFLAVVDPVNDRIMFVILWIMSWNDGRSVGLLFVFREENEV